MKYHPSKREIMAFGVYIFFLVQTLFFFSYMEAAILGWHVQTDERKLNLRLKKSATKWFIF